MLIHDAHWSVADRSGDGQRVGTWHAGGSVNVTPVTVDEILLGKTIPYFVMGMIGLALCLLAAESCSTCRSVDRSGCWEASRFSIYWFKWAWHPDLIDNEAKVASEVTMLATFMPAVVSLSGFMSRPAEHVRMDPGDDLCAAGPIFTGPLSIVPGRRCLGRHSTERSRASRDDRGVVVAEPADHP